MRSKSEASMNYGPYGVQDPLTNEEIKPISDKIMGKQ